MARPSPSKDGNARRAKGSPAGKRRIRSQATAFAPELFPDAETSGFAPRPQLPDSIPSCLDVPHEGGVSKQAVKFFVGVLLLPVALILSVAFLRTLKDSVRGGLLAEQSFGCLVTGMLLFGIIYALIPRKVLMISYVFGHEVTHALWVKLFGGSVANHFHVSLEGGHVLTDKVNTWIVLSPYFFPFYGILAGTLYGALLASAKILDLINRTGNILPTVASFQWLFLLVLGFTLAFHLVFTFLLVTRSQPDLHYGGTFFSLVVIYLINLLIITGLLLSTSRHSLWEDYAEHLASTTGELVETCGRAGAWLLVLIQETRTR